MNKSPLGPQTQHKMCASELGALLDPLSRYDRQHNVGRMGRVVIHHLAGSSHLRIEPLLVPGVEVAVPEGKITTCKVN